jgi:hypothetical protein
MTAKKSKNVDPLYELFEHYLVTKSYEDSAEFTKQLAERYVAYLDSTPAHVPFATRASVIEDLTAEAHEMLVKKMYGCMRAADYMNSGKVVQVGDELALLDNVLPTTPVQDTKG